MEILHLTREHDWEEALVAGEYRISTRGAILEEVGFVHASTAEQLPGVATLQFSGCTDRLVVLVMDDEAIRAAGVPVRYEGGGDGQLFPHIYGAIRPSMVSRVVPAEFDSSGRFLLRPRA
ncbi:MAG TPA: DUF952 domain-containing protein [Candidatus Nanopelagicales bacterium]